jgi:hypothetical protein
MSGLAADLVEALAIHDRITLYLLDAVPGAGGIQRGDALGCRRYSRLGQAPSGVQASHSRVRSWGT